MGSRRMASEHMVVQLYGGVVAQRKTEGFLCTIRIPKKVLARESDYGGATTDRKVKVGLETKVDDRVPILNSTETVHCVWESLKDGG